MDKSHVGLGYYLCPVSGQKHSEAVLLETRFDRATGELKQTLDRDNFLGWELSPENQKLFDDGFIAMVEIDEDKSSKPFTLSGVYRLGRIAHVRREAFGRIFGSTPDGPMVFAGSELLDMLEASQQ